jgi:integrase
MKNKYTLSEDGTTATIFLKRRNGDIINCHVEIGDLPKLLALRTTWCASWRNDIQDFYVECTVRDDGEKSGRRIVRMHRFLMDAPEGLQVDHRNHITTDNRRSNLRIVTQSVNQMNRKGATRNSKTGHRGISFHRARGKFRFVATINGKKKHMGYFSTVEDALEARKAFPHYQPKTHGF